MAPRRDPNTGKFVAGGDYDWHDLHQLGGQVLYRIPAADLSGTTLTNAEAELLDFSGFIDNDEVFEMVSLQVSIVASTSTTASGEGHVAMDYAISRDNDHLQQQGFGKDPVWAGAAPDEEQNIVDIRNRSQHHDEILYTGRAAVDNGESDDVNGNGRGGFFMDDRHVIDFRHLYGEGPTFDTDDEIYFPAEFYADAVANFGINLEANVSARGIIHELD